MAAAAVKAMSNEEIERRLKRKDECVKVAVRCRPLSEKEVRANEEKIVVIDSKSSGITIHKPPDADASGPPQRLYTFDYVYDESCRQRDVYDETARPIIDSVINGYNGTIFAYGQTGTGKTFTMEGVMDSEDFRGIMPNSFHHIFESVTQAAENIEFLVRVSFLEIYNDDVYDLLNAIARPKMKVRESKDKGIFVANLSTFVVKSVPDLMKVLKKGQKARKTGATAMNPGSSRSHSILTITIENSVKDSDDVQHYRMGKLNMVDLAGSERQKKTESSGARLDEAKAINLSLAALGNVIKALVNPVATHVPFRDSKLTRLLQDSLGGNTRTVMIANIGPAGYNYDETVNTLRYANRAKNIKNKPKINEDPKDAMLRQYQEEIAALKARLEAKRAGMAPMVAGMDGQMQYDPNTGGMVPGSPEKVIEEKIVEKVVIRKGLDEGLLTQIETRSKEEQERLAKMTEMEREEALRAQAAAEEHARRYQEEQNQKQEQLAAERQALEVMEHELREKEHTLLQGGVALEIAAKQQQELEATEEELRVQREQEEQIRLQMEEQEERELYMQQEYHSRREELEKKTKILKKGLQRLEAKKNVLADMEAEWEQELENMVNTIRDLERQRKLKDLILACFIPVDYVDLIAEHSVWDEYNDAWHIEHVQLAGNLISRARSRASSYADVSSRGGPFDASLVQRNREGPQESVYLTYGEQKKKKKKKSSNI